MPFYYAGSFVLYLKSTFALKHFFSFFHCFSQQPFSSIPYQGPQKVQTWDKRGNPNGLVPKLPRRARGWILRLDALHLRLPFHQHCTGHPHLAHRARDSVGAVSVSVSGNSEIGNRDPGRRQSEWISRCSSHRDPQGLGKLSLTCSTSNEKPWRNWDRCCFFKRGGLTGDQVSGPRESHFLTADGLPNDY